MNQDPKKQDKVMENTPNSQPHLPIRPENLQEARAEFLKTYISYISQEQPALGNFAICPFAKNSNYKIIECSPESIVPDESYDVILYVVGEIKFDQLLQWVDYYNKKYANWLFFEDHSDYDTFINKVQTNNGNYNLIIGQPKEKLLRFREALKKTDYYTYWSPDYYNEIVG